MEKDAKKVVKFALYNYPKFFDSVVISTVEWAESNMAIDYSKVAVSSSPGNYKESQLCKILDDNQSKLKWCNVVEKVLEHYHFDEQRIKFIQTHFFKHKSDIATCMEVGICRATFFNWQNEILDIAVKWAKELKLIKEN